FEGDENEASLGESFATDSSVENEVVESPFSQNNRETDDSLKLRQHSAVLPPQATAGRRSGPIMTTEDSESNLYDLDPQQSRSSQVLHESSAPPCSSIHTSAKDLGLDPNLLHVFVFSDAGKPIYTRYGDESKLAHVMGVMQALVSVVAQLGDQIQTLVAGDKNIIFRSYGHLILVAVGSSREPTSHLSVVLKYVYNQIVSALTTQRIDKWFMQKQNLDLRNLMIGDSRLLTGAVELVETQMGPTLNAVLCIPLPNQIRDTVVQAIVHGARPSQDLLFAILLTNHRVVCIVSMKKHFLHPIDIHLITNLVRCSQSFRNASTNWLPICLPKFNSNGYLYANLSYLDNHSCLVLMTVDSYKFYSLQKSRDQILSRFQSALKGECLQRLAAATWPDVASLGFGGGLRHFVCKLISAAQYTTSRWIPPYNYNAPITTDGSQDSLSPEAKESIIASIKQRQENLLRAYRVMHKNLHCKIHPVSCIFQTSDTEAQLASIQGDYEVYMTLEPLVSKQEAFDILKKLTKWISSNKQRLFILSSPTF
ncbi:unnamed protein product, partial [Hymenolepis diminuta]